LFFRIPGVLHAPPLRTEMSARIIAFVGGDHAPAPIFRHDGYPVVRQVDWSQFARISHGCILARRRGSCSASLSPNVCERAPREAHYSGRKEQNVSTALPTRGATFGHARHGGHVPVVPFFSPPHSSTRLADHATPF